jgi:hypothetical protein
MPAVESVATQSIAQLMLTEFETQAPITRRFLERLPEDKLTWKPHEKSMTAGQLAFHLATVPGNVLKLVENNPVQARGSFQFPQPAAEIRRCCDERNLAPGGWRSRVAGAATGRVSAQCDAEPLVPASRAVQRVFAAAEYRGACELGPERRRAAALHAESGCGVNHSEQPADIGCAPEAAAPAKR